MTQMQKLSRDEIFRNVLMMAGSETRAAALVGLDDRYTLTADEARDLLADNWTVMESWGGNPAIRERIRYLLDVAGYVSDTEERLTGTLVIYRGNMGEDPCEGVAWTLDIATAQMFAAMPLTARGQFLGMRQDGTPSVWRATVEADDILGYFVDRGEREIIVNPDTLDDVELIQQAVRP